MHIHAEKSGGRESETTKHCHMTCHMKNMITYVQILGEGEVGWGCTPKIWKGKSVKNSAQFETTFDFQGEYFRTDRDMENRKQT